MDHAPDVLNHVAALAAPFLTMDRNAPQIKHVVSDKHYPGQECLSMAERSFGRALALYENLFRLDGAVCRVSLRPIDSANQVWKCITPNADQTENTYLVHTEHQPWLVRKLVTGAGGSEREEPSPFDTWANLDAKPRWDNVTGEFANLSAWNTVRYRAGRWPMVADPSDDKHIYLLSLAMEMKFGIMRLGGWDIHPKALNQVTTGYVRERMEWTPEGVWLAEKRGGVTNANPLGDDTAEFGSPIDVRLYDDNSNPLGD